MTTKVKGVGVSVNVMEKSVTYVANTVIQLLFRIAHSRGLSPNYLQHNLEIIENGLRTWLSEQKLRFFLLQVYVPGQKEALENWETVFSYYADPNEEVRKPPVEEIEEACKYLSKLPSRTTYTIYASVDPGASEVAGWVPGTPKPLASSVEKIFKDWGFGNIGAEIRYQGSDTGNTGGGPERKR